MLFTLNMRSEDKVINLAYFSRLSLILLQYLANQVIPDHDAKVFLYPAPKNKTEFDKIVDHFFGGFLRWDAQYFIHIAKHGYTYENTLAFFPLYPLVVGFIGDFVADIFGRVYLDSILLLTFICLNIYLFKQAALTLYKLTEILFNKKIARDSAILFCFNPASVFFSAPYTESLFSYLTFLSILNCLRLYEKYSRLDNLFNLKDLVLVLPIALSTVTRSNGLLNIGFLIYTFVCLYKKNSKGKFQLQWSCICTVLRYGCAIFMTSINCILPFVVYQYYCFIKFCHDFTSTITGEVLEHAKENKFILPGSYSHHNQKWCRKLVPLAYSYVQDHYWNVGFLRYYQLKQLPNFLLALPIILILLFSCVKHIYVNIVVRKFYSIFVLENPSKIKKTKVQIAKTDLYQPKLNVFYIHALFLSLFCIFFIHIQVSTRFLCSATPVFYWICSKQLDSSKLSCKSDTLSELFIRTYFVSFFFIGTMLFCNFFPWT